MAKGKPILKTEEEVQLIKESCQLVSRTLGMLREHIKPGVSTLALDRLAEDFIRSHAAVPAFKHYKPYEDSPPFPATLCVSVNEEVVHGVPSANKILKEGDIVSVDTGVCLNGYFGDSAYTFAVGEISAKKRKLLDVTKSSLYKGIARAVPGNFIGDIANAVQTYVESYGYSVVREMVGHGLGKSLHEAPEVPNYGKRKTGELIKEGLVIAIEPMINMGRKKIKLSNIDKWTIFAADLQPSAHFEHTIVVGKDGPVILTTFDYIENQEVKSLTS